MDPRTAGVEQPDDRRADFHRLFLHLDDLLGVGAGQRPAEHREIFREHEHHTTVDRAPTGDDAIPGDALFGHAEIRGAVLHEHVELFERVFVQQKVQTLPGGELALGVLAGDPLLAAAHPGLVPAPLKFLQDMLHAARPNQKPNCHIALVAGSAGGKFTARQEMALNHRSSMLDSMTKRAVRSAASSSMPHCSS